ncbi:MAG TPA: alpha/beta hydrolase [Oculatellaceae cyanobacterium]
MLAQAALAIQGMLTPQALILISISVASLAALYLVCAPRFNFLLYRPMLFHPWKLSDEPVAPPLSGVIGADVYFPSANGKMLNGWYYRNPSAKYTVLFSHGNGGNVAVRSDLVGLLLKTGLSVFIYDYGGYGESLGRPSVEAICEDGIGAYRYLTLTQGIAPDAVILYGESLGTSVSTYISSKFACRALILQSGFISLRRIACELFPLLRIYPQWLYPTPALDNAALLQEKHPPLLILHGEQDTLIPLSHARYLYAHALEPKKLVKLPGAGHANIFSTEGELYTLEVADFVGALE